MIMKIRSTRFQSFLVGFRVSGFATGPFLGVPSRLTRVIHICVRVCACAHIGVVVCSFLTKKKKKSGTRTFHDVYCSKPLTFHNG